MDQEKIGKFIAKCRKDKNLTQQQLAEKLDITDRAVSKWERGLSLPDVSIMLELCKILEITINELFAGENIAEEKYKEVTDKNLLNALENSAFTLKDKIEFYKNKWEKEHLFALIIWTLIIAAGIIYGFIKDNGLQYVFIIVGLVSGVVENNRKMAYIEKHTYGKKEN